MPHSSSLPVGLLAVALTCGSSSATADPVTIAAGSFLELNQLPREPQALHLEGTSRGFTLDVSRLGLSNYAFFQDCSGSPGISPCLAGNVVSLNAGWSGSDLPATVTLDGQSFPTGLGLPPDQGAALVDFRSAFVVPAFSGVESITISVPFTFSGSVLPPIPGGEIPDVVRLVGHGTVVADLRWITTSGGQGWGADRALYTFEAPAAVPEPATLLLVGSGITACVIRRRKRTGS